MRTVCWKCLTGAVGALLVCGIALARDGRIIAIGDEWLLSDPAFTNQPAQTTQLADNIATFFTQNTPSRFLVYSTSPFVPPGKRGVLGDSLANRMLSLGHTWEVNPAVPFTLATLQNYRGVFLSGVAGSGAANAAVLKSYVNQGGNVLVMAGTGDIAGGAGPEAGAWNFFLNQFGLSFGGTYFGLGAGLLNVPTLASANPLGKLITVVEWGYGHNVTNLQPGNPTVELAVYGDFTGMTPLLPSGPIQPIIGTVNLTTKCLGDLNNDGLVDDADFALFVPAYNLLACSDPAMPPGCPADLNSDGLVDDGDFTIFVQQYDLLVCP